MHSVNKCVGDVYSCCKHLKTRRDGEVTVEGYTESEKDARNKELDITILHSGYKELINNQMIKGSEYRNEQLCKLAS